MARKAKKQAVTDEVRFPRHDVPVPIAPSDGAEEIARKLSASTTSNEMAALRVMRSAERKSGYWESVDVPTLMDQLRAQAVAANHGDMSQAEAMLINQAAALQSLFVRLAERGMTCDHAPAFEANMRMALRAQSQCRATLETLVAIKNPPIVYAKQANVTTGPQQVNNGIAAPSQARDIESEQTQLSGGTHDLLPDTRASGQASRVNPALETLGEIDRAEDPRG
jgi:hypothetical protein